MTHRTPNFKVGDRVDRTRVDGSLEVDGRVMAVLNYGRVIAVQWPDGITVHHLARYLTPHTEG